MPHESRRHARILIVDDTPQIHADLRKLLAPTPIEGPSAAARALAIGDESPACDSVGSTEFEIHSAFQGQEGVELLAAAIAEGHPHAMAFIDMRMPPGWDGLETCRRMLELAPNLQVVLCTAYSDHAWDDIRRTLGQSQNVLVLKKPFEGIEARQLAWSLSEKSNLVRELHQRSAALEAKNAELEREIERRARAEVRLVHEALHDSLTDLPNRALISDRVERSLAQAKRDPSYRFALLFLDLDDFKIVNDSLGHSAGDRLLTEIAERIVGCTRQSDCASRNLAHTTARLGGDEFLVLLDGLAAPEDADYVARRILDSLAQPFVIDGHTLRPSGSIGIAHGNANYDEAQAIVRDADTALYRAKSAGKRGIAVFDSQMRHEALARLRVESDLRNAIRDNHLFLQYQPIVNLQSLRIEGFEALVRWRHPEQGVISPADFVPLAEQSGLIVPLGEWVLRTACEQTADWRRRVPNAKHVFINVNFSPRQLAAADFVDNLLHVLEQNGLDRRELHVEVTESVLLPNIGPTSRALHRMNREQVQMHVDDFGVGLGALNYLHRLPVSAVKLDRSFLRELVLDPDATESTIGAVIQLARARKLRVVAEGVETAEQLALLQRLGCDLGQGFYFARPLDIPEVEAALAARVHAAA